MPVTPPPLRAAVDAITDRPAELGITLALVVVQGGEVVAEWYGRQPDTIFGPGGPVGPDTRLISWSTAKSMTHAAVGIAVADGLLEMRPGLRFVEDYVDDTTSHCIDMLFGAGAQDHAAYAAALPLDHPPGTVWNYSSGTTNIVCRILGDAVAGALTGGGEAAGAGESAMRAFLTDRLFAPVGMTSAEPRFDAAGTWVGSSYVDATARDFARFGELYLRDGLGPTGVRVLPAGWADHGRTVVAHDAPDGVPGGFGYGRHWWTWPSYAGSIAAHGYEGQYVVVVPERELVVAHLGKTDATVRHHLVARLHDLIDAC